MVNFLEYLRCTDNILAFLPFLLPQRKCVTDSVSRNALTKFETVIGKLVSIVEANMRGEMSIPLGGSGDITTTTNGARESGDEGDVTMVSEMGDLSIVGEGESEELQNRGREENVESEEGSNVGDVTEGDEEGSE